MSLPLKLQHTNGIMRRIIF